MKRISLIPAIVLTLFLLTGYTKPIHAQESARLFQKGLVKEEGEGSLKEAIEIYKQLVENPAAERSVRAKALLHVGICYEKLGQKEAKKAYEKLIADFADQEKIVAIGKEKLSRLNIEQPSDSHQGIIVKELWSPAEDTYSASPDGRYLTYIDWYKIELAVKDLQSGKTWEVTQGGTWKAPSQFPDNSIWSPDSKQIAYFWFVGDTTELHIVNRDGTGDRIICRNIGDQTPWPVSWSSNGEYLLAFRESPSQDESQEMLNQVVLVSVNNGDIQVLNSSEETQSHCCGSISPDLQYVVYTMNQEAGSPNGDIYITKLDGSDFSLIVHDPANDKNPLWNPEGTGILFMSDRTGTNDLWSQKLKDGKPNGLPELVMSNLGKTRLMGVIRDRSLYYTSSHARSDMFIVKIDPLTGETKAQLKKITTPQHDRNMKPIWSEDGRYLAYESQPAYRDPVLGHQHIFLIYDTETGDTRKLDTDLHGSVGWYWNRPVWSPDGNYLMVQGRTADKLQGFFLVDVVTGKHKPVMVKEREPRATQTPIGAFPTFSKDGKEIYYLSVDKKSILKRNLDTDQVSTVLSGPDEILYFKPSHDESMIALGYFFTNRNALYMVATSGGEVRKLADFEKGVTPYVVAWSQDDNEVIFEKGAYMKDQSHEIWRVAISGSEPEMVVPLKAIIPQGEVREVEMHPDGQQVVISVVVGQESQVWALENIF